jgi:hypothetical protein
MAHETALRYLDWRTQLFEPAFTAQKLRREGQFGGHTARDPVRRRTDGIPVRHLRDVECCVCEQISCEVAREAWMDEERERELTDDLPLSKAAVSRQRYAIPCSEYRVP